MTTIGLRLDPLDVLFFRDGRPFNASSRASTGLPTPQVLAGALRTALLAKYRCPFDRLAKTNDFRAAVAAAFPDRNWIGDVRFRGPWFCRGELDVLVPMPATLLGPKKGQPGAIRRLRPRKESEVPGWKRSANRDLRPLWDESTLPGEAQDGFLNRDGLLAFLGGSDVDWEKHVVRRDDLFGFDYRTGIGIEPDRLTAEESMIYGVSFLAPKWKEVRVGLYAEVEVPDGAPRDALDDLNVIALGGEGRRVKVESLNKPFDWPEVKPAAGQKAFLLLTTPVLSSDGWKPSALTNLVAAAVPAPLAVSGWDLAKGGPKPTRFAVPAGSVYFLDDGGDLLAPLARADDAPLGWGCYLKGAWTDA
jgi:CRISPR-associated protein Cmr3